MPPKASTKSAAPHVAEPAVVRPMQAVILSSDFTGNDTVESIDSTFSGICDFSLLELCLNFVSQGGVRDSIVVCRSSDRTSLGPFVPSKHCRLVTVSDDCMSECDALREVYGSGFDSAITSDFILLRSTSLYAASEGVLLALQDFHRQRKSADKEYLMTKVLVKGGSGFRPLTAAILPIKGSTSVSGELLKLTEAAPELRLTAQTLQTSVLDTSGASVRVETDIHDGNLEIVSLEALKSLSEQPDYKRVNAHWITRTIDAKFEDRISGESVGAYVVDKFQVFWLNQDLNSLTDVSKHITDLATVVLPVLPKKAGDSFVSSEVAVPESSEVHKSLISKGVVFSGRANIDHCVISGNVKIGKNTKITNSFISGEIEISNNLEISNSVIIGKHLITSNLSNQRIGLPIKKGHSSSLQDDDNRIPKDDAKPEEQEDDEVFFISEVAGFVQEGTAIIRQNRHQASVSGLKDIATQLRMFRTTQNQSVDLLMKSLVLGIGMEISKSVNSLESRKEQQSLAAKIAEAWSDVLLDMYIADKEVSSGVIAELAILYENHLEISRFDAQLFWITLWALFQADCLVGKSSLLNLQIPDSLNTQGLKAFLSYAEAEESDDDDDDDSVSAYGSGSNADGGKSVYSSESEFSE